MKKILIIFILVFLNCKGLVVEQKPQKPNILLLYIDDLRPELASFGAPQIHSPNIDTLAEKGIKFTNAYCNVPVCGASRASMLTGMLPTKNRFLDYKTFVEEETPEAVRFLSYFKKMDTPPFLMERFIII